MSGDMRQRYPRRAVPRVRYVVVALSPNCTSAAMSQASPGTSLNTVLSTYFKNRYGIQGLVVKAGYSLMCVSWQWICGTPASTKPMCDWCRLFHATALHHGRLFHGVVRLGRYSLEMYFWDSDVELFTLTLRGEVSVATTTGPVPRGDMATAAVSLSADVIGGEGGPAAHDFVAEGLPQEGGLA